MLVDVNGHKDCIKLTLIKRAAIHSGEDRAVEEVEEYVAGGQSAGAAAAHKNIGPAL